LSKHECFKKCFKTRAFPLIAARYVSSTARICFIPQTHNSFGDRSFSAAGPHVWNNSLPPHLRQDVNARFLHRLTTFLFSQPRRIVTGCCSAP